MDDYLPIRYKLTHDTLTERTLLVRRHDLEEDEQQLGKTLQVLNVPFFLTDTDLQLVFTKCSQIDMQDTGNKHLPLKSRSAIVRYDSKVKLEKELRLIKHSIETMVLYDSNMDLAKNVLTDRCGLALLDRQFVQYPTNQDQIRSEVMEVMRVYNDEILDSQKKKKRRYERDDEGWTKVVRK